MWPLSDEPDGRGTDTSPELLTVLLLLVASLGICDVLDWSVLLVDGCVDDVGVNGFAPTVEVTSMF